MLHLRTGSTSSVTQRVPPSSDRRLSTRQCTHHCSKPSIYHSKGMNRLQCSLMRTQELELTLQRMYHMSNRPCIQGNYGTLGLASEALALELLSALRLGLALEALAS